MGLRKKIYLYDKDQFTSPTHNNLYFYLRSIPLDYKTECLLFQDIYANEVLFSNGFSMVEPVKDTYKNIVELFGQYHDIGNRIPLGFSTQHRAQIISMCMKFGYKSIQEDFRPTIINLGEVFKIDSGSLQKLDKIYNLKLKKDPKEAENNEKLSNFISSGINNS